MNAIAKVIAPDNVPVQITIEMTLGDWKRVAETARTQSRSPEWKLAEVISMTVRKIETQVYESLDASDGKR